MKFSIKLAQCLNNIFDNNGISKGYYSRCVNFSLTYCEYFL